MPSSSGGACSAMTFEIWPPQSPPCATKLVYPRRFISTTHARAMCSGSQPVTVGLPEKPYPGIEGITTSNASAAVPPCAVGSVSGPMSFSCSRIEPGHPCVMMTGSAFVVLRAHVNEVDL